MQKQHGLRPDLIFFTGDAAFGEIGKNRGELIADQFREAHDFLTAVREAFDPPIEQRNLFLVPGNHDVNRTRITLFESAWLQSIQSLDEINILIQKAALEWRSLLQRLDDYAHFLSTYGYDHLLTGRERLIYADAREVAGLRVGIAGFNSTWSSRGAGREEMGRLWMAGRFQLETLRQQLPPHDFAIALVHHPANWLVPEENPSFGRQLERDFPFVLHGHEHQEFVRLNGATGHTVLSAGACHEWSESKNNGYNFVRLDFANCAGEVWLRQYDTTGGGWCPRVVFNQTDDAGCWRLTHLHLWMKRLMPDVPVASAMETAVATTSANPDALPPNSKPAMRLDPAADYELRYRKAVVDRLDYIQLFGIDVPKEAKEYSLTVAYVSLNLADEDDLDSANEQTNEQAEEAIDEAVLLQQQSVFSAEQVFDQLCPAKHLLLIRGEAGSGKTTLLRWAAVQAGKHRANLEQSAGAAGPAAPGDLAQGTLDTNDGDWRSKVPFVIRLRDYANGQLPRPREFPLLLAKELPDPPAEWVDNLLRNGRGLIMLDGVDEVPSAVRSADLLPEIRQLIQTYPDNYYVVTTRPGADVRQELREMGFVAARVEKMGPHDRDIFIDRWHEAMEVRLRNWGESIDLRPLAKRLKQRLPEIPAVARLTVNPLLCAVVCALHRQRNENLPETPVDLCEKLCEMLLDRRDAERPGFDVQKNL